MASKLAQLENGSDNHGKAKWTDTNTETFLKICVEEIEAGNRPHTHFNKDGWNNLMNKFNSRTGKNYDKKQLKNKWDSLKQEFGLWAKLVEKETGLGWDPVKNTVVASAEWWEAKGKENPKYLNWKEQGPKFLTLMQQCFKDVVATGYAVFMSQPHTSSPVQATDNELFDENEHNWWNEEEGERDTSERAIDHNEGMLIKTRPTRAVND